EKETRKAVVSRQKAAGRKAETGRSAARLSISTLAIIMVIDLSTIALSCAPFYFLENWVLGTTHESVLAWAGLGVRISGFYLFVTQALCGKTFGMMKTRTHIVDARSGGKPSPGRIVIRTAGFYLSLLPALLGFFWVAIDAHKRSWMDLLSGTKLIRDSE